MFSSQYKNTAQWLGYLGILPVFGATLIIWMDKSNPLGLNILHNYAAIILTFVGAIHWGRSMKNANTTHLTLSVLPSLYAFICLLLPAQVALPMLMVGFITIYLYDTRQYSQHPWFKKMRQRLTWIFSGLLFFNWLSVPAYA